jgi:uracil-DNA glycosylase
VDHNGLIEWLRAYPANDRVFNQYRDVNTELDQPQGAESRCRNLHCYLDSFADARFLLVGEAAGYAGCRFSGVPFTSEAHFCRQRPLPWTVGKPLLRTSLRQTPWVERSAGVVWQALQNRNDCLLWNAFPWHPMGPGGPLTNRPPGRDLDEGAEGLRLLLALFPNARSYAIGRVAQRALASIGVAAPYIRHPSHGGQQRFLRAMAGLGAGRTSTGPCLLLAFQSGGQEEPATIRRHDERERTGRSAAVVGSR